MNSLVSDQPVTAAVGSAEVSSVRPPAHRSVGARLRPAGRPPRRARPPASATVRRRVAASHVGATAASGLRGRGGAGFPTRGQDALRRRRPPPPRWWLPTAPRASRPASRTKTLAGDRPAPGAGRGRRSADALGASRGRRVRRTVRPPLYRPVLDRALSERRAARSDNVDIRIEATPDRYVAGEASALVHPGSTAVRPNRPSALHQTFPKQGRPATARPSSTTSKPSPTSPSSLGTAPPGSAPPSAPRPTPGSSLVTVSGAIPATVVEVDLGTPVLDVLQPGRRRSPHVSGVLVGGYGGAWSGTRSVVGRLRAGSAGLDRRHHGRRRHGGPAARRMRSGRDGSRRALHGR